MNAFYQIYFYDFGTCLPTPARPPAITTPTLCCREGSGGAMVLGKLPTVEQGPTALAVGAGGGCLDIFTLIYPFFPLSPSLWDMARYRLKYCLKGPLNQQTVL